MITLRPKKPNHSRNNRLSFQAHLEELRSRIFCYVLVLLGGSIIGYFLHPKIIAIIIYPLNQPLYYTSPTGGLDFILKTSVFFGFIVSLPVGIYQLIRFIEPVLPRTFPRLLARVLLSSTMLLICGLSFAYFISLPTTLYFLNKFAGNDINALISTTEYFSFVARYLIGFGLVFQLPLIMLAINAVHSISLTNLLRFERWVIVISFIFAGILTPTPDLFNQSMIAIPLILLYQVTILLTWLVNRKQTQITTALS